jgi:hypothetical protein
MKKIYLAIIAITAAMSAHATNDHAVFPQPVSVVVNPGNSNANSSSVSGATASASSRTRLGQNQNQTAKGGAGGAGGSATSSAKGGSSTAKGGAANASAGSAFGGQSTNTDSSSHSVSVVAPRSVASAYAPSINPTTNCAGSVAGGAQGAGFGISLGGSTADLECQRQELAKTAYVFGDEKTAEEILCDNGMYRAARKRTGRPCAKVEVTAEEAAVYSGNDPIVRQRLGMPALR